MLNQYEVMLFFDIIKKNFKMVYVMLEKYMKDDVFIEVNLGDIRNENDFEYLVSVFVKFDAIHEDLDEIE
jgi:hypothetical protein